MHVDIDKEVIKGNNPTFVLLPNRGEEDEINNIDEKRSGNGNINEHKSNSKLKPPEKLGSVPYF